MHACDVQITVDPGGPRSSFNGDGTGLYRRQPRRAKGLFQVKAKMRDIEQRGNGPVTLLNHYDKGTGRTCRECQ